MSQVTSGLLPALVQYYERLEQESNSSIAEFGFSCEKISFQVVISPDGTLVNFEDIRQTNERGKRFPNPIVVPDSGGRPGSGFKPFFCWDNTGYALGCDNKGNPKRVAEMFAEFKKLHLSMLEELRSDMGYVALCRFLEKWNPENAESLPNWKDAAGLNVVFRVQGHESYVHQGPTIRQAWLKRVKQAPADGDAQGRSLVSGELEELARLHPMIGGVAGTNTTGAAIVSFNLDAFTSYGKDQSYNAPVGVRDAFRYTTSLNQLLAEDSHRVRIGDATVVFWTDRRSAEASEQVFRELFGESIPKGDPAECGKTLDQLRNFLQAARKGQICETLPDPDAPFYILGLSPNASRINVRFWLTGTVAQFADRLARHIEDLEMIGQRPENPPLVIRGLLREVMPQAKSASQENHIANLSGELARAILGGLPYPQVLFNATIQRIRGNAAINHCRAAILKAFLVRNRKETVPVALNKDHPDQAYQLGRLFAALEKTQEESSPGINSTIKDRYFGSASATPASVFPRLLRLHQHHLDKLENPGMRVNREKLVGEVCSHVEHFPSHLGLEKQGLFYIGYYHQRQDFFTKKNDSAKENGQ